MKPEKENGEKPKVVFCVPTLTRPYQATLDALRDSVPLIIEAGWDEGMVSEVGCPYISAARATMLRKALDAKADVIVFIDHDVSWKPADLLTLIETEGDMVAGTYRYKDDKEKYMGTLIGSRPIVREKDGAVKASAAPAGFLKITRHCVNRLMEKFPGLIYGEQCHPYFDLFNHGAHEGVWWGEDYALGRRWLECDESLWIVPDLDIAHHSATKAYPGNFHHFLRRQPGGDLSDCPKPPT